MKQQKALTAYIDKEPDWWQGSLEDYSRWPAKAFLREVVHLSDAIRQCRRLFKRKADKSLNKDGQDSIYRWGAAALSAVLGHFETFQRALFAGMLEFTRLVPDFDVERCCSRLEKDASLSLQLARLSAYRGHAAPIGQLVADHLAGWHNPDQVNLYFGAIVQDFQFYSKADAEQLRLLWQLRHAVVHTGGWLSRPDAQRIGGLASLAEKPILFNEHFSEAACRRLHLIVARSTGGIGKKFVVKVPTAVMAQERRVKDLFVVESPRKSWLP